MFKPGAEAGSDHFLPGRPRGDRKPDDTYPSYHLSGSLYIAADIEIRRGLPLQPELEGLDRNQSCTITPAVSSALARPARHL